jgi:DNA polymerase III epsilon subunit-like protein
MHVMVDLETMGTRYNAAIIAIGAVSFDMGSARDEFCRTVSLASSCEAGLSVDAGTIMWWMQQSEAARSAICRGGVDLRTALLDFSGWANGQRLTSIWGDGATFDNVILTSAYAATRLPRPWSYRQDRCYRTLRAIYPDVPRPHNPSAHNALADARSQAEHLLDICRVHAIELL